MSVLDKLEPHFVKGWEKKRPPRWLTVLAPHLLLRPDERYSVGLYLREATASGVSVIAILTLSKVIVWVFLWHQYPALFGPRYHRVLIGLLSHQGVYWYPYIFLFLLLFNYAINFPYFYFWNRRAARLQSQSPEPPVPPDADPAVWPPAPLRPTV